jgi:hypothetical protein
MKFRFSVVIAQPPSAVFAFFRDVDQHAGQEGTPVPVYDKVTPGPVGVGTRYREVVQVLPKVRGEMLSEVTCYEEGKRLGYRFSGLGMDGELEYIFEQVQGGTGVVQLQSLHPRGALRPFSWLIGKMFAAVAGQRLETIKALLEQGSGEVCIGSRTVH